MADIPLTRRYVTPVMSDVLKSCVCCVRRMCSSRFLFFYILHIYVALNLSINIFLQTPDGRQDSS